MSWREVVGRIGRWPRRAAAAACLLLALVSALDTHRDSTAATGVATVVAARTLPAGHTLTAHDVRVVRLRPALPGTAGAPRTLVGRVLAGPTARGEPITLTRLVGPALTRGLGRDQVAMSITVADDARGLVSAGVRIDVMFAPTAESTTPAQRAASGVLVLAVAAVTRTFDDGGGSRLVLAVTRADALRLSHLSNFGLFRVAALRP